MIEPQYTICEACGNPALAANEAEWTDDGSSFCKACRPAPVNGLGVVAWRVKDFSGGWILCPTEQSTRTYTTSGQNGEPLVRLDAASALLAEKDAEIERLTRERNGLIAGVSALVNCQSALTRSQMREAAKDLLDEQGLKVAYQDDQSPFVIRAAALERERDQLREETKFHRLHIEALAEIKATIDGDSEQPVKDIIYGLIAETAALSTTGGSDA